MCLVCAWNTGLEAKARAEILSHQITGHVGRKTQRSRRSAQIQESSAAEWTRDLYSASVDERATICCFFAHQETGLEPKNTQYPVIERRSMGSPAQSAFEKTMS